MVLVVQSNGHISCLYGEQIDLASLGSLRITRASRVEPDDRGRWWADLTPSSGPVLGPFSIRSAALLAEQEWLETNWLAAGLDAPHP